MFTSTCQAIWTWDWPPTVQLLDKRADCLANGRLLSKWTNTTQANPGTPQNCLENQASIFGHFCGTHASQMLGKQSNICDLRFCLQKQSLRIAHNCLENQAKIMAFVVSISRKAWNLLGKQSNIHSVGDIGCQKRLGNCLENKAIFTQSSHKGGEKGIRMAELSQFGGTGSPCSTTNAPRECFTNGLKPTQLPMASWHWLQSMASLALGGGAQAMCRDLTPWLLIVIHKCWMDVPHRYCMMQMPHTGPRTHCSTLRIGDHIGWEGCPARLVPRVMPGRWLCRAHP